LIVFRRGDVIFLAIIIIISQDKMIGIQCGNGRRYDKSTARKKKKTNLQMASDLNVYTTLLSHKGKRVKISPIHRDVKGDDDE